jgi:hypothetical protein
VKPNKQGYAAKSIAEHIHLAGKKVLGKDWKKCDNFYWDFRLIGK